MDRREFPCKHALALLLLWAQGQVPESGEVAPSAAQWVDARKADDGTPSFDHDVASTLATMGIPAFACTPDVFPEMIALAINGGDLAGWASTEKVAAAAG